MRQLAVAALVVQGLSVLGPFARAYAKADGGAAGAAADPQVQLSDRLFKEAKRAQQDGDLERACDGFARSLALVPRSGTSLNLGLCREQQHRLVEARSALKTTLDLIELTGGRQDRIPIARAHLRDIEAALSWIDITLAAGLDVSRVRVTVDGTAVDPIPGSAPVDNGKHVVSFRVDAGAPHLVEFVAGFSPEHRIIQIAPPAPAERVTPPAAAPRLSLLPADRPGVVRVPEGNSAPRRSHVGWWIGASGLVVAVGVAALLIAFPRRDYPPSDVRVGYP